MANKNPVNGVLNYVLGRFVTTERYRQGLQTGTRANFHMEASDAAAVIQYIVDKKGCTVDQAVASFTQVRGEVLKAKAASPKEMGAFVGLLVSVLLMFIPGYFLSTVKGSMWLKVALLAAVLAFFFLLVYFLVWNPRHRAMKTVWNNGKSLSDRLQELHEVQEMSRSQLIGEYQKPQGTIFAIVAVIVIFALPALWGSRLAVADAFHKEMSAVTVSADNVGTRYVVYDVDERMYVDKYLSDERQATSAEDVCAVLHIEEGQRAVGRYEGQGSAYQRYVTIKLVDQRTGRTVFTETIYGGQPPSSISVKVGSRNRNGYGSHPSTEDISKACELMIQAFEAMK